MQNPPLQRVLVLVNPRSGPFNTFNALRRAVEQHWEADGIEVFYQFSLSAEDGVRKVRRAADSGMDAVLIAGGDGTVNTLGSAVLGSDMAVGVIPLGSGNGFARHFGIPLTPERAVEVLRHAEVQTIDVGVVEGRPFLITCSMAWDASIVKGFERSPIRGILPYVFAGVYEFLSYRPQPMSVEIDGGETLDVSDALLFTIANLTQFGGGAQIAPQARADDGFLELVVAMREDAPILIGSIGRLFDGTVDEIPEVLSRRFKELVVRRHKPAPIQVDGELMEAPATVHVKVLPGALRVLVPRQ